MTLSPGIHDLPAADYHLDPCEQPSLSASMAAVLCTSSPAHAWTKHPVLNPDYQPSEEAKYDLGRAAHSLILERDESTIEVFDYDNWRTKAAQEAAATARLHGKTPMLLNQWSDLSAMVVATHWQLAKFAVRPSMFVDGKPEQTLVWEEDGVWCRARCDWLHHDYSAIDDLKTTSRSANPERWTRGPLFDHGADIQAAFYLRGLKAITGVDAEFRWCVVESSPPYALSVIAPGPDVLALANVKVDWALATWRECLRSGDWPAYETRVCYAQTQPWMENQWLERQAREEWAA